MNVSSDALNTKENKMSTQESTTKMESQKKAKTSKRSSKPKKGATLKKAKSKGASKSASKAAIVLELMKGKEGATLTEIAKVTAWQNHSIRGFVSGHVTKKLGLKVESTKNDAGERMYRIVG